MATDKQLTKVPNVAYTAVRFTLGGIIGCVALSTTLQLGGILALFGGPIAFFAGAFWAAGELHLGVQGRIAFGVATMLAMFFSVLGLVGTQGMHGDENIFQIVLMVVLPYLAANAIGSLLGIIMILPDEPKAFRYAVIKGFVAGAIVSGLILGAEMGMHLLNFYTSLPLIAIPSIAGGTAAAWALRSIRRSGSESDQ
jgi:hypothetical protein